MEAQKDGMWGSTNCESSPDPIGLTNTHCQMVPSVSSLNILRSCVNQGLIDRKPLRLITHTKVFMSLMMNEYTSLAYSVKASLFTCGPETP